MTNFSLTVEGKRFDIVPESDFMQIVERVGAAWDLAEEDTDDGIIPERRRGQLIEAQLTVTSDAADIEETVENRLLQHLSKFFSDTIDRKCRVGGVFRTGDQLINGRFSARFEITSVTLS